MPLQSLHGERLHTHDLVDCMSNCSRAHSSRATCAVLDPEFLDVLPAVVQHLPLRAVGHLRETCRTLRNQPCVLAVPEKAASKPSHKEALLQNPGSINFLLTLPSLRVVHVSKPQSLFGLHLLPQLSALRLVDISTLDMRPLSTLKMLRHLALSGDPAAQVSCLGELTQLTSLSCCGGCMQPGVPFNLTGLQRLDMTGIEYIEDTVWSWAGLTRLTELRAADKILGPGKGVQEPPLQVLHVQLTDDSCYAVDCIEELRGITRINTLTLDGRDTGYHTATKIADMDMGGLADLARLQQLCLKNLMPSAWELSLAALTSLTFMVQHEIRTPVLRSCNQLQVIHVFIESRACNISRGYLPPFSLTQPLEIRYTTRSFGRLVLDANLVQGAQLCPGLHVEYKPGQWPSDDDLCP